jgi:hypothetical protein
VWAKPPGWNSSKKILWWQKPGELTYKENYKNGKYVRIYIRITMKTRKGDHYATVNREVM